MGRSSARCLPISRRPAGRGDSAGPSSGSSGVRSAWQPGAGRPDPAARRLRELVVPGGAAVLSGAAPSCCCSERLRVGAFAALAGGPGLALLPLLRGRGRGRTVACHFPPGTFQRHFRTDRHVGRPFAGGRRAQRGELRPGNPQRPALLHGGRLRSGEGLDCEAAMSSCFRLAGNFFFFFPDLFLSII